MMLCLLCIAYIGEAQELISGSELSLKKGFYRTYGEMKANSPSVPFNYPVGMKKACIEEDCVYRYRIRIERSKAKQIGEIYGFSDGENIFVRIATDGSLGKNVLTPNDRFSRIDQIGRYGFYSTKLNAGGGKKAVPADMTTYMMDFVTDEKKKLNENIVSSLIEDNVGLLAEFKGTKRKKRRPYGEYVKRYLLGRD